MFVRGKGTESDRYVQIVGNHRKGKQIRQRVIRTLGREADFLADGGIDGLLRSLARFGNEVRLPEGYDGGNL